MENEFEATPPPRCCLCGKSVNTTSPGRVTCRGCGEVQALCGECLGTGDNDAANGPCGPCNGSGTAYVLGAFK